MGTYTASAFDIFRVPGPPLTNVTMTMEILGRDGCTFWGHAGNIGDGIPGIPLLGLIRWYELEFDLTADESGIEPGTRRELSTASILQIGHVCVDTSAVDADCDVCGEVCLNTSAVVGAHFEDDGADGALVKWHYVGTADDGQNAEVFDAVFAKNNDATAAPTTRPGSDGAAGRSVGFLALAAAAAAL